MNATLAAALSAALMLPAADDESWRSQPPPIPPPEPAVLPQIEKAELPNGLVLYAIPVEGVPLVSFELVTVGGSSLDPAGKAGLTGLTYDMLEEGAGDLDALAFSDRVADFGARFGAGSGRDSGSVTILGLARHGDALLELLRSAIRKPRLEEGSFTRVKQEKLANLQRQLASPQGVAFQEFPKLVYGPEHPFGHPPTGTPESLLALTLGDVKAQAERVLTPKASALIAAGDIDMDRLKKLARTHFGDWTGPDPGDRSVPPVQAQPRKSVVLIDKPGLTQTIIVFGRPLFGRGHPDELPVELLSEVLGGSFSSRLNMNLREDKGYAYGAQTQVAFRNGVGVLLGLAAVQADQTGPSLDECMAELERLRTQPPTAPEVRLAKDGIVRSLTGQFASSGSIASAAASLFVYDLPLDHLATLGPRIENVPLEDVLRVRQLFEGSDMQVLLVGDAKQVVPQLTEAGFTEIELRNAPGNP